MKGLRQLVRNTCQALRPIIINALEAGPGGEVDELSLACFKLAAGRSFSVAQNKTCNGAQVAACRCHLHAQRQQGAQIAITLTDNTRAGFVKPSRGRQLRRAYLAEFDFSKRQLSKPTPAARRVADV